jgi:hypothetical protein
MSDTLNANDQKTVIKVRIGDTGPFRRFRVEKICIGRCAVYEKLVDLVNQDAKQDVQQEPLKLVYIDEEGDEVFISSDEDLKDAIIQCRGKTPPILRVVTYKDKNTEEDDNSDKKNFKKGHKGHWKQRICKLEGVVETMKSQIQELTLDRRATSKAGSVPMEAAPVRDVASDTKDKADDVIKNLSVEPPAVSTNITHSEHRPKSINTPTTSKKSTDGEIPKPKRFSLECFNSQFIHGRHTCDGCYTTPIIGYRYNATNLPDYDVCQKCFNNYKGEDVLFQPEQLQRDEHLQRRWLVRYRRSEKAKVSRATIAAKRAEEEKRGKEILEASAKSVDRALNEAIRRSLNDELKKNRPATAPASCSGATAPGSGFRACLLDDIRNFNSNNSTSASVTSDRTPKQAGTQTHITDFESDVRSPSPKAIVHKSEPTQELTTASDTISASSSPSRKVASTEVMIQPVVQLEINKPQLELSPSKSYDGDSDDFSSAHETEDECGQSSAPDLIVEGEDDDDAASESNSEGSSSHWQVVDNDGAVNDEMVAQAAQMLGSALFQSDMASYESGVDVHMTTDSVSSGLTSVPTIASKSAISAVVLQRWEEQLKQLHELGFLDDHANVDALGHLEAANIGVGETAPIRIDTVVEHLLKQKEQFEA